MKIVPATREHLLALYPDPPKMSMRGFAVVDGDKVLGIGGAYDGINAHVVFFKITDELRKHPVTVVRLARRMMALKGKYVVAKCDPTIEAAGRFLARFGFTEQENGLWTLQR